ncbi:MAG: MATE family efflux transporter [Porphyromonadaceae bacterium]|nr:MATE family efflux transporter [Porphyromonadaceae bacterium]
MKNKTQIDDELGNERIGKLLWKYSVPAIVGTMLSSLYNIVDRIYIGLGVGPLAISGLALTFPFMNFLAAFSMLIGAGASARISIRLGEGEREKAEKVLGNAFTLTLLVSAIIITFSLVFLDEILIKFGGSENTLQYAKEFMVIIIPGTILSSLLFGFNSIMRASGYPKKAMITMIISALVNISLAPIFIFGLDMGIAGAAHATNIAFFVGMIWVMSHFFNKSSNIQLHRKNFKPEKQIVKSILNIGISPFSMMIAASITVVIMNRALIQYGGDLAVGALGIQNGIAYLFIMFIIGLNQGAQPILGFNYGAANYTRMFSALKKTAIGATVVSSLGFVMGMFFPYMLTGMFTNDVELRALAARALTISMLVYPLIGSQIVFTNFFQSIGKAKISMFLSLTRQVLFLIPCLLILPPFFDLDGVWAAMPVSDSLSVIVTTSTLIIFIKRFQKKNQATFPL